jgi:protein tyrosine/serine phosphatase
MTLSPVEWAVLGVAAALVIGIIGYFLKRTMSTVDSHDKDINEGKRIYATKDDLKELKTEMRDETKTLAADVSEIKDNYLKADDYYRAQAGMERKLDQIYGLLMKAKGGAEFEQ